MNATDLLQKMGDTLGTAQPSSQYSAIRSRRTAGPWSRWPKWPMRSAAAPGAGKGGANAERQGEGGGGGGAVRAFPAGALEITNDGTRFVPFMDLKWLVSHIRGWRYPRQPVCHARRAHDQTWSDHARPRAGGDPPRLGATSIAAAGPFPVD